jgi:hypothetical protein
VRVHEPPPCSPDINENKSIRELLFSQTVVEPSRPALGCAFTIIVVEIEQESVAPVRQVTVKVYVPGTVGVPEMVNVPAENVPVTPGGKSAAGTDAEVAPVDEV